MKKCPQCGSTSVAKEYYLGSQTGDYVCGDCGETAWASYFEKGETDLGQEKEHLEGRFKKK